MPLCTHGCFARAAQLAHRSCPDSKFPVLHSLAGELSVYRGTAWRNNLIPWIVLELASPDAHNPPDLHREKSKWKFSYFIRCYLLTPLHLFLLVINKRNWSFKWQTSFHFACIVRNHCLGLVYSLLEAIDDFAGHFFPLLITKVWLAWSIQGNMFKVTMHENLVALLFHCVI